MAHTNKSWVIQNFYANYEISDFTLPYNTKIYYNIDDVKQAIKKELATVKNVAANPPKVNLVNSIEHFTDDLLLNMTTYDKPEIIFKYNLCSLCIISAGELG
jgi:hypothetical protein